MGQEVFQNAAAFFATMEFMTTKQRKTVLILRCARPLEREWTIYCGEVTKTWDESFDQKCAVFPQTDLYDESCYDSFNWLLHTLHILVNDLA